MTEPWLNSDPIAASIMRSGASESDAYEAVERVGIEREGRPSNGMADAFIANRVMDEIKARSVSL